MGDWQTHKLVCISDGPGGRKMICLAHGAGCGYKCGKGDTPAKQPAKKAVRAGAAERQECSAPSGSAACATPGERDKKRAQKIEQRRQALAVQLEMFESKRAALVDSGDKTGVADIDDKIQVTVKELADAIDDD